MNFKEEEKDFFAGEGKKAYLNYKLRIQA